MIKDIKFKGYTQVPNDYESPDGELDGAIGLVPEDGAIKPILPAVPLLTLGGGEIVVYVHDPSFTHYICNAGETNYYFWIDKEDSEHTHKTLKSFAADVVIHQITSVGNTLMFLTSVGVHYFLWKDGAYKDLGTHLPELPISFGLQGKIRREEEFNIVFDPISEADIFDKDFTDDNKRKISDQVLAKVNKFISEQSVKKGRFLFPFFVRYAYRLYDGSLTMHSAPVLMVASSDLAPQVAWLDIQGKGSYTTARLQVLGMLHKLDWEVLGQSFINSIREWSDIVTSVDIFVSSPIYTYDQAGECTRFVQTTTSDSYSICKMIGGEGSGAKPVGNLPYQKYTLSEMYALAFSQDSYERWEFPTSRLMLPQKPLDKVAEEIRNVAQFYFLKSYKLDELSPSRRVIEIPEDYLQSLVARERLPDDYDSHDQIIASYAYGFNNRLNLANIKKELFGGYHAGSLFPYTHNRITSLNPAGSPQDITITEQYANIEIFVAIKQDGKEILVDSLTFNYNDETPFLFFYYPNPNAYKAYIQEIGSRYAVWELPLEKHSMLNGAYYFGGWERTYSSGERPPETLDKTISLPNKIYTSEVNNPFFFPLLGINTVGTGEILGICSATKALSQGQFGQFPLYAFTSEGVWALETNTDGTYSARQPITRDVCSNPRSITQLDNSVLFTTARGIMMISGSQSACITDVLDGTGNFVITLLQGLRNAYNMESITSMVVVKEFIKECQMLYDYRHQRIIVFNPKYRYAYVFSQDTQMWGMMASNLVAGVNSYPEALAMTSSSQLVDLSQHDDSASVHTLLVTRPLKLDTPDMHKTIDTILARGHFRKGHVSSILYGSRDLYNWHLVYSSRDHILRGFRGTPYKYFRLVLIGHLDKDESLTGCTIQYTQRLDNQPR